MAVYPKPGHTLDPEDLRRHVGAHLAAFNIPARVLVCDEPLPRNASGRLLRRALREQVLGYAYRSARGRSLAFFSMRSSLSGSVGAPGR